MKVTETNTSIVVDTPARRCRQPLESGGLCQAVAGHAGPCTLAEVPMPPRVPPPNGQRFEPGAKGPCRCSMAAVLDKITGLCPSCWRVFILR